MASSTDTETICNGLRHQMRRDILRALDQRDAPLSPREFAVNDAASLSCVAYHFHVLEDCGLVQSAGTERVRGTTKHLYVADPKLEDYQWIRKMLGLLPPDEGRPCPGDSAPLIAVGRRVRELREEHQLTQGELAERAKLALALVEEIERGLDDFYLSTLVKLAGSLEVDISELLPKGDSHD